MIGSMNVGRTGLLGGIFALAPLFAVSSLDPGEARASASLPTDHSGTYLLLQQSVTVAEVPVLADVVASTRTLSLQKLSQTGNLLQGDGEICDIVLASTSGLVKMELPEGFRKALPKVRTLARLEDRAGELAFNQDPQILVLGARLKALRDALPVDTRDPRVWDQDGDGHPGVTVRVSGFVSGELYLATRSTSSLSGRYRAGEFLGALRFSSEESILDATNSFLKSGLKAKPDLKRSYFRLWRVPDSTDCVSGKALAAVKKP